MDLWIRSQDKQLLKIVNQLEVCEDIDNTWFINDGDILGKYKTKERALEVLDEIQKILKPITMFVENETITSEELKALENSWKYNTPLIVNEKSEIRELSTYVYEMPKE